MLPMRNILGLPRYPSGKEVSCQCRRHQETWIQLLGQEYSLEQEMTNHSSILAREISWPEDYIVHGLQRVGHNFATKQPDKNKKRLDSVGEGEGGMFEENSIETCILSRVKQITSPCWMHETSARTWCTGKT